MLVRLLYASRATVPLDAGVLDSIMRQSRANNPKLGVTGILCYSGDLFIQVLEGGRDEVCDLYNTIVRDDRQAMDVMFPPRRERGRDVRGIGVRAFQPGGQIGCTRPQRGLPPGRQQEQEWARLGRAGGTGRRFLDDQMRVRAAEAE